MRSLPDVDSGGAIPAMYCGTWCLQSRAVARDVCSNKSHTRCGMTTKEPSRFACTVLNNAIIVYCIVSGYIIPSSLI